MLLTGYPGYFLNMSSQFNFIKITLPQFNLIIISNSLSYIYIYRHTHFIQLAQSRHQETNVTLN